MGTQFQCPRILKQTTNNHETKAEIYRNLGYANVHLNNISGLYFEIWLTFQR